MVRNFPLFIDKNPFKFDCYINDIMDQVAYSFKHCFIQDFKVKNAVANWELHGFIAFRYETNKRGPR